MKFRDPKTGKLFYGVASMWVHFCEGRGLDGCGASCPIFERMKEFRSNGCLAWCEAHWLEAVQLMGYEIIEDNMSTEKLNKSTEDHNKTTEISTENVKKPLTDWTAGEIKSYCAMIDDACGDCEIELRLGECPFRSSSPDKWNLTEKPRWTEQEIEDAKVLSRALLASGFQRDKQGDVFATSDVACRTLLDSRMFPSLAPGQTVTLDEIIGGGT